MENLLKDASDGSHEFCNDCPWNPRKVGLIAFGVSCEDHGVKWSSKEKANSMLIVQDPAGTTPGKTGRLCFVHNSKNPTDKTAQHANDLWNSTVAYDIQTNVDPYLRKHYWTNALLHGADKKNQKDLRKPSVTEKARKACSRILYRQIDLLQPKVIIANGEFAANSLFDLRLLSCKWEKIKPSLADGVYKESSRLSSGLEVTFFCTYHTSMTPMNTHIAKLYSRKIQEKLDILLSPISSNPNVISFLRKYPENYPNMPEGKGMRVLLLHWLEIGKAIRAINEATH